MAQDKVTMPMSSAGIMGFSSDTKLEGIQLDPKMFVIAAFVFVILVKIADFLTKTR